MNGFQPLVSIGVPVYNGEKYLLQTLESIGSQTYKNIEIIVIDDDSTDDSYNICNSWLQNSGRPYSITKNEKNRGVVFNANEILNACRGEYLQIFGQDDILLPGKIENDLALFNKNSGDVSLIYSKVTLIDENGNVTGQDYLERINFKHSPTVDILAALIQNNFIPAPSVIMRTSAARSVGGYDESLIFEDWQMWLKLSYRYKILFRDQPDVQYRIHKSSMMSHSTPEKEKTRNRANIKMFQSLGFGKQYHIALRSKIKELAIYSFYLGDDRAKEFLRSAFKRSPGAKILLYLLLSQLGLSHPASWRKPKAQILS